MQSFHEYVCCRNQTIIKTEKLFKYPIDSIFFDYYDFEVSYLLEKENSTSFNNKFPFSPLALITKEQLHISWVHCAVEKWKGHMCMCVCTWGLCGRWMWEERWELGKIRREGVEFSSYLCGSPPWLH